MGIFDIDKCEHHIMTQSLVDWVGPYTVTWWAQSTTDFVNQGWPPCDVASPINQLGPYDVADHVVSCGC